MNASIPAESPRYKAFISYSHADRTWWGEQWGRYLHRRIEGLPLPGRDALHRALVRSVSSAPAARRIFTGSDDGGVSAIELNGAAFSAWTVLAMPGATPLQATDAGERWMAACGR